MAASGDGAALVGHLLELERSVNDLLAYIPATFPHYTRHTLPHSVEIVDQIGRMLLSDDGWTEGGALNATEIYGVCCAALLHDAGMVASETEQAEILASDAWTDFVDRYAAQPWRHITQTLEEPNTPAEQRFLAHVELRRLIAEHLRRIHHQRSRSLTLGKSPLPDFSVGDRRLQRVVADVCEAHGLPREALSDDRRFPTQTDLLGEPVDVRFLAILLRIGDLLDLSHDRACPLTAWAVGALPASSIVHWDQFDAIRHRTTTPAQIEITAECENETVYRVLRDWCRWICEEVAGARALLARSPRHSRWHAPVATMGLPGSSISVAPAPGADFIPSDWRLSVDAGLVVERFMSNVHEDQLEGVILELVQNAVDATRCRAVAEATAENAPAAPYALPENHRRQYPITVRLYEEEEPTDGGNAQRVAWLDIADRGIGMDADDVTDYLLQVGRSFYQTRRFREEYGFAPAGQFGVGFLTVLGISGFVEIDTLKRGGHEPVHVTITGPDDYVIRRRSQRRDAGTRLRIRIDKPIQRGHLSRHVERFRSCEFPIAYSEGDHAAVIFDEIRRNSYPAYSEAHFTEDAATVFGIRVDEQDVSGWVTARAFSAEGTILLGRPVRSRYRSPDDTWATSPIAWHLGLSRRAELVEEGKLPDQSMCLWGVLTEDFVPRLSGDCTAQIDYRPTRGARSALTLDRQFASPMHNMVAEQLRPVLQRFFARHLSDQPQISSEHKFLGYRQELAKNFSAVPVIRGLATVETTEFGQHRLRSIVELRAQPVGIAIHNRIALGDLGTLLEDSRRRLRDLGVEKPEDHEPATFEWMLLHNLSGGVGGAPAAEIGLPANHPSEIPLVSVAHLARLGNVLRKAVFGGRAVHRIERLCEDWWRVVYAIEDPTGPAISLPQAAGLRGVPPISVPIANCSDRTLCICRAVPESDDGQVLPDPWNAPAAGEISPVVLNANNALGEWLAEACSGTALANLDQATEIRGVLASLIHKAACGRHDAARRLNAGIDELRALTHGDDVEAPPELVVIRDSALGLATRARPRSGLV